jgi:hypothetical protein
MARTWLIFALFVGMLLVVHGIYEEKLQATKRNVRVEYRFVPRTFYEEQLANAEGSLSTKFKNMFEGSDPMTDR